MRFNGLDTLWDWNNIITLIFLEFGMDIPLTTIYYWSWDRYTPCYDHINNTVPIGALAPYLLIV